MSLNYISQLTYYTESSSKHTHTHDHEASEASERNFHSDIAPSERLERLCMFLEAQFGADNVSPVAIPKINRTKPLTPESPSTMNDKARGGGEGNQDDDDELEALQKQEIERLHQLGIPVAGVEIKMDKTVAQVWLEDLSVDCANRVFGDRVRAVVERSVEVSAPLWA